MIHTDDLAWHEPLFDWGHLLADDVLRPLHAGRALSYRPSQWVQPDLAEAERRGPARDIAAGVNGDPEVATAFWHAWMAAELTFFEAQRPWERASAIANGTSRATLVPGHLEVAPPPATAAG